MLTNQEKEWLQRRNNLCERCSSRKYCRVGKRHGYNTTSCRFHKRFFEEGYYDAAKFAERVALWLLSHDSEDAPCANGQAIFCPRPPLAGSGCGKWCLLRSARLAVETGCGRGKNGSQESLPCKEMLVGMNRSALCRETIVALGGRVATCAGHR